MSSQRPAASASAVAATKNRTIGSSIYLMAEGGEWGEGEEGEGVVIDADAGGPIPIRKVKAGRRNLQPSGRGGGQPCFSSPQVAVFMGQPLGKRANATASPSSLNL